MDPEEEAAEVPAWLIASDREAEDLALATGVYQELRRIAAHLMRGEREDHTLQATALVHEAYLALRARGDLRSESERTRFLSFAARVMRRLLVDHARARHSQKRGGGRQQIALDEVAVQLEGATLDVGAVDEALDRLASRDARKARIVELRFFAGCSIDETAEVLGVSHATVERDWKFVKAWLATELASGQRTQGSTERH